MSQLPGLFLLWLLSCSCLQAFDPIAQTVLPRGGQAGEKVAFTIRGNRLQDVQEIILYRPGLAVSELRNENAQAVAGYFEIAADAPLGEHPFRVRTKEGVSYLRTFWVMPLPSTEEASTYHKKQKRHQEENDTFESPQRIELNTVIHGTARQEDADYYIFSGQKGQRITAELFGMRLGHVMFDPYLALLDSQRFELGTCDDTILTKRDPYLSFVLPADGDYILLVRESSYRGNDNSRYLLQVSESPRPTSVHPPAGNPGQELTLTFKGDAAGESKQQATLPANAGIHPVFAVSKTGQAPSPNSLLVTKHPLASEQEPNNLPRDLRGQAPTLPVAFHGVVEQPGDVDWFLFSAKKNQQIRIQVYARKIRSPLDPLIQARAVKENKALGNADDDGNYPDGKLDLKIPADGDYRLMIRDHLNRGGPDFTYVIEIAERAPVLSAELPYAENNNSQKHRAIVIPRGNQIAITPNVARQNTNCEVTLQHSELPNGVTVTSKPAPRAPTNFPILFSASKDAPLGSTLTTFTIKDTKSELSGPFHENIHHVEINNAGSFCSTRNERLTVAVIEEAPFHIHLIQPKVALVQNGTMNLRIEARRKEGFEKAIKVKLPWLPPGVGAPPEVTIPEGKHEVTIPINANSGAPLREWSLLATGEAKTANGEIRVSSSFVSLTIAEPFLKGSIDLATTEQGQDVTLVCNLENLQPFDGEAQLSLVSLPHKVTAPTVTISATNESVEIPLTIPKDVRPGKNKNIFAQVLIMQNKTPIPHQIAHGTTLVITPPLKKETDSAE